VKPTPAAERSLQKVMDLKVAGAALWHLGEEGILLEGGRDFFALIQGDSIQSLPVQGRGLPPDDGSDGEGGIRTITGRWPDGVWLVWRDYDTWTHAMNMWYERLFRLRKDHWERIHETKHDQYGNNDLYRGLWQQPEGCLVGLLSEDDNERDAWRARSEALDCRGLPAPQLSFQKTEQTEYGIAAVLGSSSGHVLVLEYDTEMKGNAPTPARLVLSRPGPPNRTEISLPLPPEIERDRLSFRLQYCKMVGQAPSNAYVVVNYDFQDKPGQPSRQGSPKTRSVPMLLRFDGSSFSSLPLPPIDFVGELDLGEDGTLVMIASPPSDDPKARVIWALPPGGPWVRIPMPIDLEVGEPYWPSSIAAHSLGDIWVVGDHGPAGRENRPHALFHTRSPASRAGQTTP